MNKNNERRWLGKPRTGEDDREGCLVVVSEDSNQDYCSNSSRVSYPSKNNDVSCPRDDQKEKNRPERVVEGIAHKKRDLSFLKRKK